MNIAIEANKEKVVNLLLFITKQLGEVNMRKLLKLVFLIDKESMLLRSIPLTWLTYKVWEKGPVAPNIYDIKKDSTLFADALSTKTNQQGQCIIEPIRKADMNVFSQYERDLIENILAMYGSFTADELTELTHDKGDLWNRLVVDNCIDFTHCDGKSDVTLDLVELLETDEQRFIYEDAFECMTFKAMLNN